MSCNKAHYTTPLKCAIAGFLCICIFQEKKNLWFLIFLVFAILFSPLLSSTLGQRPTGNAQLFFPFSPSVPSHEGVPAASGTQPAPSEALPSYSDTLPSDSKDNPARSEALEPSKVPTEIFNLSIM